MNNKLPFCFKHAKPVLPRICDNRLISLLPTISKIFERIIHIHLHEYFNSDNLLAEQQYGLGTNHSMECAAFKLVDHISNTM